MNKYEQARKQNESAASAMETLSAVMYGLAAIALFAIVILWVYGEVSLAVGIIGLSLGLAVSGAILQSMAGVNAGMAALVNAANLESSLPVPPQKPTKTRQRQPDFNLDGVI